MGEFPNISTTEKIGLETLSLSEIVTNPGDSLDTLINRILNHQKEWHTLPQPGWAMPKPELFVEQVNSALCSIFSSVTQEEIEVAQTKLVNYGRKEKTIKEQNKIASEKYEGIAPYDSWMTKLRMLSGFAKDWFPSQTVFRAFDNRRVVSSTEFWQATFLKTAQPSSTNASLNGYIFGPNIESKDPEVLSIVKERVEEKPIEEVLSISPNKKDAIKLERMGGDVFGTIVTQASNAGWPNAAVLVEKLKEIQNNRSRGFTTLARLGNFATFQLNRDGRLEEEFIPLLDESDSQSAPRAVKRCLYLVFEAGSKDRRPADSDPLNYVLLGDIVIALFKRAEVLLEEKNKAKKHNM